MSTTSDHFPTDVVGLPEARAPELVELDDGDQFDLFSFNVGESPELAW